MLVDMLRGWLRTAMGGVALSCHVRLPLTRHALSQVTTCACVAPNALTFKV